jgi:hypothetical protein
MQKKLVEVKRTMTTATANTMACTCNGHFEEPRAELQALRTTVTSPSTGQSLVLIASQSSVVSSSARAARAGLGLPAVILDLRAAGEGAKTMVDDPVQTRD